MTPTQELITNLQLNIKNKSEEVKTLEQQLCSLRSDLQSDVAQIEKIAVDMKEFTQK